MYDVSLQPELLETLVLISKTRYCSSGFSCFCMKGQVHLSRDLSKPVIAYHLEGWPRKTLRMSLFHLYEAIECHWAWNSSLIHISWTKMWLIRIILLSVEWFAESSFYKNVIVMTSLKCKLNCKEASRPSRTFNHLVVFSYLLAENERNTNQNLQFQSDNLEFFLYLQHFRIMTLLLLPTCRILHWLCNF